MKLPKWLEDLRVSRIALVDNPANPDATIEIFKAADRFDYNPPRTLTDQLPDEWKPSSPSDGTKVRIDFGLPRQLGDLERENAMARQFTDALSNGPEDHADLPARLGSPTPPRSRLNGRRVANLWARR